MNRRKPITPRQLAREKLLFRYSSALERGDFDTLAAILREAEADPVLEKMLAEMDAVYRAELAPLPVLPTLSTNHNHRHTREDEQMNITYPTISRRLPDTRSRGRWNSIATLAAAMIALALFAAILISRRPSNEPEQGSPGIVIQNETATPVPSSTPTPLIHQPIVSMTPTASNPNGTQFNPTPVQDAGILNILCGGVVSNLTSADGADVYTQPSFDGVIVGRLSATTLVQIMTQQEVSVSAFPGLWYYVRSDTFDGWIRAEFISPTSQCPPINTANTSIPCANITPIAMLPTFTLTWTPTPAPGLQVEPIEVTATPLSAETMLPTFVPTVPPPCIIQTLPTPLPGTGLPSIPLDRFIIYTLEAGENLQSIMARFTVTLEEIAILNPELDFSTCDFAIPDGGTGCNVIFRAGQSLRLPIPSIPINPTPIATFDMALRDGGYVLLTTEQVGDIPANALVRINSAQYNGSEWLYEVIAQDGQVRGEAHDWQLQFAPDFGPGAATPTAMFDGALGSGFYAAVTNQAVGNIPAGTPVQIGSAFYNGVEWHYNITDASGRDNTARESQLDFAPGYTPGMATPTAAYFDLRGQVLITLVQVGPIPPNTPVQATSGYYDGNEWVYGVMTLDSTAFADARASQLRVVSLDEAGVQPTSIPATFPPTLTPTPFS